MPEPVRSRSRAGLTGWSGSLIGRGTRLLPGQCWSRLSFIPRGVIPLGIKAEHRLHSAHRAKSGQTTRAVNFIEDVVERFPAARLALIAVDAEGERRVWHFGELFAARPGSPAPSPRAASGAATW